MKQTINFNQFCDGFSDSCKNNFSYEGKEALFEYLEQLEEDIGEEMEYDPVAFCCGYREIENLKQAQQSYPDIETMEELEQNTQVIPIYDYKGTELDNFIILDY